MDHQTDGLMQVATDIVVFTIKDDQMQLLLIQRKYPPFMGKYALPGGFVHQDEAPMAAAKRELQEETGVQDVSLHQIKAYGEPKRDPRGRVLSIAFLALIRPKEQLKAQTDALSAGWFPIASLPKLAFDHEQIIDDALKQLRLEIQMTNIAFQILPKQFTLTQLQVLYENVLGKTLDKRNFRKKIKELGTLKETDRFWQEGAHRPARLYEFKHKQHEPLHERMQVFLN